MTNITKTELIEQLHLWGKNTISSEQLQSWMITHYDPPEVEIGLGETPHC